MAYIKPPLLQVAFRPRLSFSGLAWPTLRSKISAWLPPALIACTIHLLSRPRRDPSSPELPSSRWMAGTLLDFAISSALGLRHRWSPDISVSALRKRKNGAWGFIRVDIKCKPDTLVVSG